MYTTFSFIPTVKDRPNTNAVISTYACWWSLPYCIINVLGKDVFKLKKLHKLVMFSNESQQLTERRKSTITFRNLLLILNTISFQINCLLKRLYQTILIFFHKTMKIILYYRYQIIALRLR